MCRETHVSTNTHIITRQGSAKELTPKAVTTKIVQNMRRKKAITNVLKIFVLNRWILKGVWILIENGRFFISQNVFYFSVRLDSFYRAYKYLFYTLHHECGGLFRIWTWVNEWAGGPFRISTNENQPYKRRVRSIPKSPNPYWHRRLPQMSHSSIHMCIFHEAVPPNEMVPFWSTWGFLQIWKLELTEL